MTAVDEREIGKAKAQRNRMNREASDFVTYARNRFGHDESEWPEDIRARVEVLSANAARIQQEIDAA